VAGDITEEEQVEAIKQWLSDNGTAMVLTIIVVLASVFGFRTWENQTRTSAEAASAIYVELTEAVLIGPLETLSEEQASTGKFLATQLKTEHDGSVYANFAAFHMAKIAVGNDDLDAAAKELEWVLDNSVDDRIAVVANFRLARVKFGKEDYEGAIAQLDEVKPGGHTSSYEELRGDAHKALKQTDAAREAYQRAINAQGSIKRPLTQIKLDNLVTPKTAVAADALAEVAEDADVAVNSDGES